MNNFLPDPDTLFYADCKRVMYLQTTLEGARYPTSVKTEDRSYAEKILRCVAVDTFTVVADIVHGSYFPDSRRVLLRRDYNFHPVGPGVIKALKLEEQDFTRKTLELDPCRDCGSDNLKYDYTCASGKVYICQDCKKVTQR